MNIKSLEYQLVISRVMNPSKSINTLKAALIIGFGSLTTSKTSSCSLRKYFTKLNSSSAGFRSGLYGGRNIVTIPQSASV